MTTKQSKDKDTGTAENIYEQPISAQMLLRSYTKTEELIKMYREKNDSVLESIEVTSYPMYSGRQRTRMKPSELFVPYENPRHKIKKQKWLEEVQNQRSGKFYSLKNLIQSARINESELQLFDLPPGVEDYPYREVIGFHRVKTDDNSEWFSSFETWTGISFNSVVVTCSVDNLHWYTKPHTQPEYRNIDGSPVQMGNNML